MRSKIAAAAVCLAASLVAPAALAQPETVVTGQFRPEPALAYGEELVTAIVRYGDLDLASAAGVDALHGRVHRAATRLCVEPGPQPLEWRLAGMTCRDDAVAGAQDQVAAAIAGYGTSGRLASAALTVRRAR